MMLRVLRYYGSHMLTYEGVKVLRGSSDMGLRLEMLRCYVC